MIWTILLLIIGIMALPLALYYVDEDKNIIFVVWFCCMIIWLSISYLPIYFLGFHYENSRGEHTGFVTAVQKQGIFYKTGRAYFKTNTQSSQEDEYCVIDEKIYNQLQELSKEKKQVTIQYFSYLESGIKYCDGEKDIIYKVN